MSKRTPGAPVLRINVRLDSDVTSSVSTIRKTTGQAGNAFARLFVRQVAISASRRYQRQIGQTFERKIEQVVRKELQRVVRLMAKSIQKAPGNRKLTGALNFGTGEGYKAVSDTAKQRGWDGKYNVSEAGIEWAPRDPRYVRRKKVKNWWRKNGQLAAFLNRASSGWFEKGFGPIRVLWFPQKESTLDQTRITSSGQRGPVNERVRVGKIEVIAFGNISPSELPGLANFDPMNSRPSGPGLAEMLHNSPAKGKITARMMQKSTGKRVVEGGREYRGRGILGGKMYRNLPRRKINIKQEHRPWVDPFVSFFLTRSMPNAVWRQLEREFVSDRREQRSRSGLRDSSGLA